MMYGVYGPCQHFKAYQTITAYVMEARIRTWWDQFKIRTYTRLSH